MIKKIFIRIGFLALLILASFGAFFLGRKAINKAIQARDNWIRNEKNKDLGI